MRVEQTLGSLASGRSCATAFAKPFLVTTAGAVPTGQAITLLDALASPVGGS